jgi:hypothetical protein
MPVATRNQSKNISAAFIQEVKKPVSKPVLTQQVITKVRPHPNNLWPWFSSVVKEGLADVEKYNAEKARLRKLIEENPDDKKNKNYKREIRVEHYNSIRSVTEVMYFVGQYYPEVRNLSHSMISFAGVVYAKVQQLYKQIRCLDPDVKPETEDEKKCIAALIYTLQDVEKMIISFLPQEHVTKRIRKFVDYTGMDTVEPYDEYDEITNIWLDTTVFTDPDYEFEEEEDEDEDEVDPYLVDEDEDDFEDEQEYKPWIRSYKTEDENEDEEEDEHDYNEDEDYVPEDEEDEEDEVEDNVSENAARVTVGRQDFKKGNHTWFTYDNE